MKGNIDTGQLKSMDYKSLQALAKDMGVNASGKKEELIARIASTEVDAPADDAGRQETGVQETAGRGADAPAEETAVQETRKEPSSTVLVEAVTKLRDKVLNQIKEAGEVYEVSLERARELEAAGVAAVRDNRKDGITYGSRG